MSDDDLYKEIEEIRPRERNDFFQFPLPEPKTYTEEEELRYSYNKMKVAQIIDDIRISPPQLINDKCFKLIPYIIYTPRVTAQLTPSIYSILESLIKERRNEIDLAPKRIGISRKLVSFAEDLEIGLTLSLM